MQKDMKGDLLVGFAFVLLLGMVNYGIGCNNDSKREIRWKE